MNFYKLVEAAKEKQGLTSDNQIALKLGVGRALISGWKNGISKPDGINTMKLIELSGMNAREALKLVTENPAQQELALTSSSNSLYIMLNRIGIKKALIVGLDYLKGLAQPRPMFFYGSLNTYK